MRVGKSTVSVQNGCGGLQQMRRYETSSMEQRVLVDCSENKLETQKNTSMSLKLGYSSSLAIRNPRMKSMAF